MSDCKVVSEEFEDLMEGTDEAENKNFGSGVAGSPMSPMPGVAGPDLRVTPPGEQPGPDVRVTAPGEQPAADPRVGGSEHCLSKGAPHAPEDYRAPTDAELEAQRQARPPVHERRSNSSRERRFAERNARRESE